MPLGSVTISASDPRIALTVLLGQDRVNVEQGYGGWDEVARPRRRALSVWTGSPSLRMTLPIIFDDFADGDSVEKPIAALEKLAGPNGSDGTPPRVKIKATGGFVPHQGRTWVIDDLAWGDGLVNSDGDRVRQACVVSLLEWIADVRVEVDSPAHLAKAKVKATKTKQGASSKRVAAKAIPVHGSHGSPTMRAVADNTIGTGEDLLTIAARELGDASRWVEIAQLNGLRDPRAIVAGQVLRLP